MSERRLLVDEGGMKGRTMGRYDAMNKTTKGPRSGSVTTAGSSPGIIAYEEVRLGIDLRRGELDIPMRRTPLIVNTTL
jgi:hypothetical protein